MFRINDDRWAVVPFPPEDITCVHPGVRTKYLDEQTEQCQFCMDDVPPIPYGEFKVNV